MIPRDYVTEWRSQAPWIQASQVEQDLVIGRALVEMFSYPVLAAGLAFRGGTAASLSPGRGARGRRLLSSPLQGGGEKAARPACLFGHRERSPTGDP